MDERESENSPALTSLFGDNKVPAVVAEDPSGRFVSPPFPYAFSTMDLQPNQAAGFAGEPIPSGGRSVIQDFIAAGQVSVTDAQRLLDMYKSEHDQFVGSYIGSWTTLESLRSRSAILTASVLTVAALHDPASDRIYPMCNQEFRRLIGASLFDQIVDRDYIWALCIASHWLSDASWTMCGVAIRRATELNLAGSYQQAINEGREDAAEGVKLWYFLYLVDRSLCYGFGRESLVRDDASVLGWSDFLKSPVARMQDKPLVMFLGVYPILGPARELFGLDNRTPIPAAYATQIAYIGQQLDQWLRTWLNVLQGKLIPSSVVRCPDLLCSFVGLLVC